MNAKQRIVVLLERLPEDARVDESDVLAQASLVEQALLELGYDTARVFIDLDLAAAGKAIAAHSPHCVFNLVESVGRTGRFAHLPTGLLESLGIPFTGSGDSAMYVTSNKPLFKKLASALGVKTPLSYSLDELALGCEIEPGEYIVKSSFEEGSVGLDEDSVILAKDARELARAIQSRLPALGGSGFAERFVDGREFNLAVLASEEGPQILPPAEILFHGYGATKRKVVGYRAKWDESSYEYSHTPRTFDFPEADLQLLAELKRIATACWRIFELSGYVRVDFRVDADGTPWILEVNANPCLASDAGFMAAAARAELSTRDVVKRIVDAAIARYRSAKP